MTQRVVLSPPPIFDEIAAKLPGARGDGVLFSWGDIIYNPDGLNIHPSLLAHEAVHGERQGKDKEITTWWARYMLDPAFRLEEEKLAHIAEYQWWIAIGANRHARRAAMVGIAKRLASPLYGKMITRSQAETLLRKNA